MITVRILLYCARGSWAVKIILHSTLKSTTTRPSSLHPHIGELDVLPVHVPASQKNLRPQLTAHAGEQRRFEARGDVAREPIPVPLPSCDQVVGHLDACLHARLGLRIMDVYARTHTGTQPYSNSLGHVYRWHVQTNQIHSTSLEVGL